MRCGTHTRHNITSARLRCAPGLGPIPPCSLAMRTPTGASGNAIGRMRTVAGSEPQGHPQRRGETASKEVSG